MSDSVPFGSLLAKIIDNRGKTCPTSEDGIPLIATNCIKNEHLYPVYEKVRYVSQEIYDTWFRGHPEPGDLIFVLKGTPGRVNWVNDPVDFCIAQDMVALRVDESKVDPKYLFAVLRSSQIQQEIEGLHVGSLIPHFKKSDFDDLQIPLVEQKLQKYIGDTYFNLSLKIDLLHRQNKTLEAMAETLFRQWFIEEAKEDWEEVPLSEVAVIQNGYAFSSKDYVEKTVNEYEVLKMGHIDKNATLKLNPKRDYVPRKPELKRFVLNYNDIVMPMTDMKDNVVILGVPALVDANDKYVLNQRVARIYLKEDSKLSSIYYLFLQLKDPDFIARLQSTANSGVQVNLSTQAIKDCPIVIPSLEKQAEHRNTITGFYEQISNNRKQIQTLENLRDTLLPKLMSGEVRVQYQTEEVA
ncbi:restriction endonuclease subunit S [Acinetobacter sp. NEB 394]|uniref:restriction endonuclease subunit S n=1 Tax=Acinetobacter sp. NEB 394 TaxID=2743575 RepID=UPI001596BA91|nr:restriction endonuclease subunit S [Acinetobacter sp. NEB 394]QKY92301.1 restriction endonuclease subunit S [Acinetobacter sp. NEB 394]